MQSRNRMFNLALIFATVLSFSSSVSAQTNSCQDSSSFFIYQGEKRQCNWVANKNPSACNEPFVKRFCPNTCLSCGREYVCKDVGVPFYVGVNKQEMECSDLNTLTIEKKQFKCSQNKYRMNCRETCRVCSGSTDPIVRPTTPTPSPNPPTNQICNDSTSFIELQGQKRQCNWIAKNKSFCSSPGVQRFCPKACNACQQFGCKDVTLPFYIGRNKNQAQFCYVLRNLPDATRSFKCTQNKFRNNCRETCQVCTRDPGFNEPNPPSGPGPITRPPASQYCEDTRSFFEVKGTKRQCNYVANKSRGSCDLDFVKRFCPKTCNACQFGCVDALVPFFIGENKTGQTCEALNNLTPNQRKFKCNQNKYRQNCRRTCGVCA